MSAASIPAPGKQQRIGSTSEGDEPGGGSVWFIVPGSPSSPHDKGNVGAGGFKDLI
jgi:hypothetical protein